MKLAVLILLLVFGFFSVFESLALLLDRQWLLALLSAALVAFDALAVRWVKHDLRRDRRAA